MAREYMYTDTRYDRLCMWEVREILWAVFDTRAVYVYVVILARSLVPRLPNFFRLFWEAWERG